jgi:hypothetical protein
MTLQGYYNRFDATKRYDELLFRASRGLQSAELNEIQAVLSDRMKRISDVLFRDGGVVRGASAAIDPQTGETQLDAGAIYVLGAVREVTARTITIPTTGTVQIGVRVVSETITELEDVSLRDPAIGTRNYQEAGSGRTRRTISWAWTGDGEPGDFYSVYTVYNGVLVTQDVPPALDGVKQLLARYDRDANGSYIVSGLSLIALGKDITNSNYTFSVQDGVANVQGNKIEKPTATPLSYTIDPDLQQINNEPKVSANAGTQTLTLNRKPLNAIQDVVITAEKTVTLTHGSFSGALDILPDTSVLSIEEVKQGATTYALGTDFVLTADQVDWSLPGAEPAPGSTYTVKYRYLTSVTPTNINPDAGTFQVTGAVVGTLVLVDYNWKMPRYDVVALDPDGFFHRIKGVSSAFNPVLPNVPSNQLQIASFYLDWLSTSTPVVSNDGTRVVSMREQRQIKDSVVELYSLVADERLQRDISSREPAAKYGVFTDPLLDNDLRDAGVAQDAVVVQQELQLAVAGTPVPVSQNNSTPQLLPYVDEVLIGQELRTGSMKINPYQSFEPLPARVTLNPAIDLWTVTEDVTTFSTESFTFGSGVLSSSSTSTVTRLVGETRRAIEFLRQRTVEFSLSGFGPGENLTQLRFDGRNITPPGLSANLSGGISGTFQVPAGVPAGNKLVEFIGQGGSYGSAIYTGQGTLVVRNFNQNTTTTTWRWNPPPPPPIWRGVDPLAQSFSLERGRHITGIDLKFAVKGSNNNPVQVQIRESSNGFPTQTVIAETTILGSQITTENAYVRASFAAPLYLEGGVEYFIVLLTNDADHAVRIAELGKFDSVAQRWVSAQPYTVGVLLSSSNALTWTAHQEKDLTFRLVGADFSQTQRTINLGSLTVSSMTDLLVIAPVELPSDATSVFFRYTRSTGEVFTLSPGQAVNFATSINDTMQVQAILNGSATESPILFPGVQSVVGSLDTSGTYVGRQFQVGAGGSTLRVVFDAKISGTANVVPQYDRNGFQSLTLAKVTPLGDGYAEYVYQDTGLVNVNATKVRLNLTGSPAHRPKVRNIRAVMV